MNRTVLVCPVCGEPLTLREKTYDCPKGHCFDRAKSGYVNLRLLGNALAGDSKQSLRARAYIMDKGYYAPLADRLISYIPPSAMVAVDLGSGEGYLTRRIRQSIPQADVYGFDLAKSGVDYAAKRDKSITYVVASTAALPLSDSSVDFATCVFAPAFPTEFARILKKDGVLAWVSPAPNHLLNLKRALYDDTYLNTRPDVVFDGFTKIAEEDLSADFSVQDEGVAHLLEMTPYAYRTAPDRLTEVSAKKSLTVERDFHIEIYKKN